MGKITGKAGILKLDEAQVLQVRSWSVDETGDSVEDTVIGDAWRTFKGTINGWSGSAEVYYDNEDVPEGIPVGSEVEYELFPDGEEDTGYAGTAIITSKGKSASFDGMTEATLAFQGSGPLVDVPYVPSTGGAEVTAGPALKKPVKK